MFGKKNKKDLCRKEGGQEPKDIHTIHTEYIPQLYKKGLKRNDLAYQEWIKNYTYINKAEPEIWDHDGWESFLDKNLKIFLIFSFDSHQHSGNNKEEGHMKWEDPGAQAEDIGRKWENGIILQMAQKDKDHTDPLGYVQIYDSFLLIRCIHKKEYIH